MLQKVLSMILVLVMLLGLLSVSAFTMADTTSADNAASSDDSFYRIVHLDCGRKYFSKDWIIALLNEMKADGYNQLQLAFGNDGLRFLLDDMSFTANGKTYSHQTVVSKVEAGNKAQNSSGDARWLSQSEMDEIIAAAQTLGIEIVPLLNLPGHANAILDIADDAYNASGSNNTLNVASSEAARNFGMAIFQKYVDYFAGKGCKFFNFGADEYANDASGTFSFGRLNSTQYAAFVSFINSLAAYVDSKSMTPRAFNDGLYYNNQSANIDTKIQCCYWSSGWNGYYVASASTISGNGHAMINTNGDYYYVLGKDNSGLYQKAAGFNNTAFMGSTINSPIGSMFCIWCDNPEAESETVVAQNVRLTMRAMALRMNDQSVDGMDTSVVTNGFNADGSLNTGSTGGSESNTKTITVAVGGTKDVTVDGDYRGSYTTENPATATVSVTGTAAVDGTEKAVTTIESGKQYLIVHKRSDSALIDSANGNGILLDDKKSNTDQLWTITKYTSGSRYIVQGVNKDYITAIGSGSASLGTSSGYVRMVYNSDGYWDIYDTSNRTNYYLNQYGGPTSTTAAGYTENGASDDGSQWLICEVTPGTKATTTITFNGLTKGTTTVTIGNVKYTINVVDQALVDVAPLTIEYWITNSRLTGSDGNQSLTIRATDNGVASEAGVSTASLVAPSGNKDGRTQEYWQTKILDTQKENTSTSGTELQTTKEGDDETLNGVAFTKVRYWGGAWQVYTTDWVNVDRTQVNVTYTGDNSTSQTYTGDKNQLVAYYMEVVDIKNSNGTTNLHVNAADWGTKGDGTGNWGYTPESDRCSVSIQLVYEDDSRNPAETTASALKSKTILYGYWDGGRGLGTMIFNGQDNYQIIKVTAETGTMTSTAASDNTVTVTGFSWSNNEETVWEGAAADSVSVGNPARSPSYDEPYDNLAWNTSDYNKNNAILLRVYVKSIPRAGALTVNYFVQGSTEPFYHYGINVAENTTFDNGFRRVVDENAPGGAKLENNTVTNYDGEQQTVQSDLSKMTEIGAQYRYSTYKFVDANRSEDGKTVNLYYTFDSTKTFVIDFGLPLVIRPSDMNVNLGNTNVRLTKVDIAQSTTYADISVDADKNITYKLNQPISGEDIFGAAYTGTIPKYDEDGKLNGTQAGTVDYSVTVIPATSVYYEDSFATFDNGTGAAAGAIWTTDTDGTAAKATTTQALSALGDQKIYGYDDAYKDSTKLSMGSAHKVTVSSGMVNGWTDESAWPTATFTFKGTGFDVISLTDNNSGAIAVDIYKSSGERVKGYVVNNYYGYTYNKETQTWEVNNSDNDNALYQIPVMKVAGLPYGEYTAKISVVYDSLFDKTGDDGAYSFWLDAIRVYDPMGKDNTTYTQDGEGYPQYIKLHDSLATDKDKTATSNAVFIDGAENANVDLYTNYGPNNEVYLSKGQAISFSVPVNDNIASIQIGAKAPDGKAAKMVVNGVETDIASATEMYYKIAQAGGNFTITNTGDGILSLTNLKITFTTSGSTITLTPPTAEEQNAAVMSVRALFAAPAEPFQPNRFEASWGHSVRKGDTATLTVKTSEDVEVITVDGQTITTYTPKTERTGWGWWAKTVTYREFTYTDTAAATKNYTVCAVNSAGVSSDPITATLTVRLSVRDWWHDIFDKWF